MDRLIVLLGTILENRLGVYVIICLAGVIGAIGDAFLNQAAKASQLWYVLPGLLCWNIMAVLFYCLVTRELMGWSVVLFLLSNIVFAMVLSWGYFQEQLSLWEWMGIALACVAVIMMEIGREMRVGQG